MPRETETLQQNTCRDDVARPAATTTSVLQLSNEGWLFSSCMAMFKFHKVLQRGPHANDQAPTDFPRSQPRPLAHVLLDGAQHVLRRRGKDVQAAG